MKIESLKSSKLLVLWLVLLSLFVAILSLLPSCRSSKSISETSDIHTVDVSSSLNAVAQADYSHRFSWRNLALDSIEIFIERTWATPDQYVDSHFKKWRDNKSTNQHSGSIGLSSEKTGPTKKRLLSESISIKAFNVNTSDSSKSSAGSETFSFSSLQDSVSVDDDRSSLDSSSSVSVYDPPDSSKLLKWSLIIGGAICIIVFIIKKFVHR